MRLIPTSENSSLLLWLLLYVVNSLPGFLGQNPFPNYDPRFQPRPPLFQNLPNDDRRNLISTPLFGFHHSRRRPPFGDYSHNHFDHHHNHHHRPRPRPRPSTTSTTPANRSIYSQLVAEANAWQAQNPDICGSDTQTCAVEQLVNGFNTCAATRVLNGCPLQSQGVVGWQVGIQIDDALCSGTIISPFIILLAAHCLQSVTRASQMTVYIGVTSMNSVPRAKAYRVAAFAQHPSFNYDTILYDSAVLRLARAIEWQNQVRPACLPISSTPRTLTRCLVSGYGVNTTAKSPRGGGAGVLRYAVLDVQTDNLCSQTYGSQFDPTVSFCALGHRQTSGSDSCSGDSGSGLLCKDGTSGRWTVRGIVSYGVPQCGSEPGVYADPYALGLRGSPTTPSTGRQQC